MALSPDDIERRTFAVLPEGYDVAEVRRFLFEVAAALRVARHSTEPPVVPAYKVDAARWPERPRPDAPPSLDPLPRAEPDAGDILRRAQVAAAALHEQAKRVLTTAQDQADAIVADAEFTAREIVASAAGHAQEHLTASTERARRHAEEVLRAERDTLQRLRAAQGDVSAAIDRINRSESRPVVDLRQDIGALRFGLGEPRSSSERLGPMRASPAELAEDGGGSGAHPGGGHQAATARPGSHAATEREPALRRRLIETGDPGAVAATDPTLVLMRNAVSRAIHAAAEERAAAASAAAGPPGDAETTRG